MSVSRQTPPQNENESIVSTFQTAIITGDSAVSTVPTADTAHDSARKRPR